MADDEKFVVDAGVVAVISIRAFRACLRNGHELVAFRGASETAPLGAGDRARVEMSPFAMSKGRIVGGKQEA